MNDRLLIKFLMIAQILDGIFTYIATTKFGIDVELNPILYYNMEIFGIYPTLIVAKTFGIICLIFIYNHITQKTYLSLLIIITFCLYSYAICVGSILALS